MEGLIETASLDIQTLKLSRNGTNFMRDKLHCEFDKGTAKPKFVAQSRPALYNSQQQVNHAR